MNLALVAWRSAFIASTSLRSFASHSAFQFAKPAPAPVQNTCCQGSVEGRRGRGGSVVASADFLASAHDVRSARSPVGRGGAVSAPGRAPPRSRWRARARIRLTPRGAPGSRRGANPKSGVRSASCVSGRFADGGERFRGRTAQDGEFAQGVDVHLHAEPETAPDERGGGGHLDSRRRHSRGSMCAARHVGSAVRSAVSFYPDMIYR